MFVEFAVHKTLLGKNIYKVLLSKFWREFLFQLVPSALLAFSCLTFFPHLEDSSLAITIISYVVPIILTNQYIINKLSQIKYKEFSVRFVKDGLIHEKVNFFDAMRIEISFLWRYAVVLIAIVVIFSALGFVVSEGGNATY